MGETDTEPVKPVYGALSLSGDKVDQKKNQPWKSNKRDYEKEIENLSRELANCKVQLEAKHAAHMQALLRLEHNQKMTYELSTLMKKSDTERNKHMSECVEGRARIHELESRIKDMTKQHQQYAKIRDQHSYVSSEERNYENENNDEHITISLKEYKSMVGDAKKANEVEASAIVEVGSQSESELLLKEELEAASLKIEMLRAQAEEALNRAELAEKGKAALEDKFKRQREHRHRKRAALAALREASTPQHFSPSTSCGTPKVYQPLGKVLNMKL